MPEKETLKRARRDKRQGKSPSTQAGEFVREEIHHVREGKHGAQSTKQVIAIGLSKARRAGVKIGAPPEASQATKRRTRGHAGRAVASPEALARQAKETARRRGPAARRRAAKKAVRTKGAAGRRAAARKAARTRQRRRAVVA
jgi:hypothetical protein